MPATAMPMTTGYAAPMTASYAAPMMAAPMIPALNDHELEAILIRARQAGATHAGYILLRLPLELKELFEEWLDTHYPDRKRRVLKRLREMRGGELYRSRFGERMRGSGELAKLLEKRFRVAVRQQGFDTEPTLLDASRFRLAEPEGAEEQLNLFGDAPA